MKIVRIASVALLLAGSCALVGPSLSQTQPTIPGMPQVPAMQIPGVPKEIPGFQSQSGTTATAQTAVAMPKGKMPNGWKNGG
jgi:hypothetical protein